MRIRAPDFCSTSVILRGALLQRDHTGRPTVQPLMASVTNACMFVYSLNNGTSVSFLSYWFSPSFDVEYQQLDLLQYELFVSNPPTTHCSQDMAAAEDHASFRSELPRTFSPSRVCVLETHRSWPELQFPKRGRISKGTRMAV